MLWPVSSPRCAPKASARLADVINQPGQQLPAAQPRRATLALDRAAARIACQSGGWQHPLEVGEKRIFIHRLSLKPAAPQINSLTALHLVLCP